VLDGAAHRLDRDPAAAHGQSVAIAVACAMDRIIPAVRSSPVRTR
jgi:hypothetical protein